MTAADQQALDAAVFSAEAPAPKLRRPIERVGTSAIAKFRVALGRREWQLGDPDYIRQDTAPMKRGSNISKALLVAAGTWPEGRKDDATLNRGTVREPEIFAAWGALVSAGWFTHDFEAQIDPASIVWRPPVRAMPRIVDPNCDYIDTSGFDGDCLTRDGEVVAIDAKCARYRNDRQKFPGPVWWDRGECPWWYRDQLDAIMSIRGVRHSLLIVGGGWNRDDDDGRGDGPIRVFYVPRDESRIHDVRSVARETIERVQALKTSAQKAA